MIAMTVKISVAASYAMVTVTDTSASSDSHLCNGCRAVAATTTKEDRKIAGYILMYIVAGSLNEWRQSDQGPKMIGSTYVIEPA